MLCYLFVCPLFFVAVAVVAAVAAVDVDCSHLCVLSLIPLHHNALQFAVVRVGLNFLSLLTNNYNCG